MRNELMMFLDTQRIRFLLYPEYAEHWHDIQLSVKLFVETTGTHDGLHISLKTLEGLSRAV